MNAISFVVITHRKGLLLKRTLAALSQQLETCDEAVVVDDGGEDAAIVADFPQVRYLAAQHEGYRLSLMCNLGVFSARNERIVKIDGDCIPQQGFVANWRHCMASPGIWGGRIDWQTENGPPKIDYRLSPLTLAPQPWFAPATSRGEQIYGGNMAFFKGDAIRVGGFHDGFHFGWGAEDGDFARKLHDIGRPTAFNWNSRVEHQFHQATAPHDRYQINLALFYSRLTHCVIDPPLFLDVSQFARER